MATRNRKGRETKHGVSMWLSLGCHYLCVYQTPNHAGVYDLESVPYAETVSSARYADYDMEPPPASTRLWELGDEPRLIKHERVVVGFQCNARGNFRIEFKVQNGRLGLYLPHRNAFYTSADEYVQYGTVRVVFATSERPVDDVAAMCGRPFYDPVESEI